MYLDFGETVPDLNLVKLVSENEKSCKTFSWEWHFIPFNHTDAVMKVNQSAILFGLIACLAISGEFSFFRSSVA